MGVGVANGNWDVFIGLDGQCWDSEAKTLG